MADSEFLGFLFDGHTQVRGLIEGITTAVAVSYAMDGGVRTDSADRERVRKCIDLIRIMRGDMKWSVPRILDNLPRALSAVLQHGSWEPDRGKSWSGDNARLVVDPSGLRHALPD